MKRKCLIEDVDGNLDSFEKKIRANFASTSNSTSATMHKNSIWYRSLLDAEKTCLKEDKIKKIHYKFDDGKEMVEEYNIDTQVLLRRAWKVKAKLGGEGKWDVEVGDPIPDGIPTNMEAADITERNDQPQLTRRNTRVNLEWRIRNLPYPIETYSVSANNDERRIIIRTTNKKYFKKLEVPELDRLNLPLEQANIQASHKYNTLIIVYKKPQPLLDMEKEWYEELKKVKAVKDIPDNCKAQ
ncbi:protein DPCD [Pectinophora gossypiella]|uniref:Protein DPCD n=3 Tax=Pectinophora gossypiella TaxID=13191 RepID=A0A1E1W2Z5_PECGO|nr:protein DPCD [Pectinophora gossypiella]